MSADKQTRHRKPHKPRSDFQRLSRRFMSGFLRSLFLLNKPARASQAGFVLPTTVLLLLVMTLTIGAMSFRTASRTQSAFLAREQKTIDNIAAPAADRAKAKLEYLFGKDTRMPGSNAPPSDVLATLMLNIDSLAAGVTRLSTDPYTLPDETRIDINNDGTVDNAWSFAFDLNGDDTVGGAEIIAYSVLMDDSVDPADVDGNAATVATATRSDDIKLEDTGATNTTRKANNLITRNGPINTTNTVSDCGGARTPTAGWQTVNSSTLEKNFQITAFVSNGKNPGRANSALELQQVRLAQAGNTWGAWFKYDLEVNSSSPFNWNGAMHTDGNMMAAAKFNPHMISSHNSCLYTANSSEITMAEVDNNNDGVINIDASDSEDFQGQLLAGVPAYASFVPPFPGKPLIHLFNGLNTRATLDTASSELTTSKDSVTGTAYSNWEDILLDPLALFTQNISHHRRTGRTGGWSRAADWATNPLKTRGRVLNKAQTQPFLDDFYRADNRYGPRPNYQSTNWVTDTDDGTVNTTRSAVAYDKKLGDEIISTDPRAGSLSNESDGLDGYWERQSISSGMRVVVGQRLELGDRLGWNFDAKTNAVAANADPLYPPNTVGIANKQKQRVTLKDNLSAVQGMVVYQYENDSTTGNMPLACMANTAHPATLQTLRNSRTFNIDAAGKPKINFFEGQGTNGWEFAFPTAFDTESEFGAQLTNTMPLGIALRNLAYFAGDPNGGAPSFTPVQDSNVHPFAHQAMWGDFSVLRRIFADELDRSAWNSTLTTMATRYAALSPADKSSLHSAACTMGLLAYNADTILAEYTSVLSSSGSLQNVGVELSKLIDGVSSGGNPEIEDLISGSQPKTSWTDPNTSTVLGTTCPTTGTGRDAAGFQANCDTAEYYQQFTTDNWVEAYRLSASPTPSAAQITAIKNAISSIKFGGQIIRDRALGFVPGNPLLLNDPNGTDNVSWNPTTGLTDQYQIGGANVVVQVSCDPDLFDNVTNSGGGGGSSSRSRIGFALVACSAQNGTPIKYPSLYYLFPMVNHDHNGALAAGETGVSPAFVVDHSQPTTEEYINKVATYGANAGYVYQVLEDTNNDDIENSGENGYADIAFLPRASDPTSTTNTWKLPTTVSTAPAASVQIDPESMDIKIITSANNRNIGLSLLDKVLYNGREEMAVRVLDIDLGELSRKRSSTGDYWISDDREEASGIFYAAREDAVREDSITRPKSTTDWTSCDEFSEYLTTNCLMRASTTSSTSDNSVDPPLSKRSDGSDVGISIKPVDFVADPDRRPYGFRLNANLGTNSGDISNSNVRARGLTFVTDNAAYIKGVFNPHTSNGTDTLEEFTQTLLNGSVAFGVPFYDSRTTKNAAFATTTGDRWRVVEVLADAVHILSSGFVDGAIDEGFISSATASSNFSSLTSFHNQQRPLKTNDTDAWGSSTQWVRGDGTTASTNAPIWVGRNGESRTKIGTVTKDFTNATDDTNFIFPAIRTNGNLQRQVTDAQRVNATIISGIVPSRLNQTYGGLHNFPRFLEKWTGKDLFIQGAFLQLNFSTSGTGPFNADAWNPGDTLGTTEYNMYYKPPNRLWGYDVGLQLVPTGPIAARFVSVGRPRSEHYRELSIEDPYVTNLRCSKLRNGTRRFPNEAGCL